MTGTAQMDSPQSNTTPPIGPGERFASSADLCFALFFLHRHERIVSLTHDRIVLIDRLGANCVSLYRSFSKDTSSVVRKTTETLETPVDLR